MSGYRPVRRAQLIGTFGVGAMVDLPNDESLMVAGLDVWPFANETVPPQWAVMEERLATRLGVKELRLPPDYRTGKGTAYREKRIPSVRFPGWHYCPRCGDMKRLPLFAMGPRRCSGIEDSACSKIVEKRRPFLIPVRIVSACVQGHIQDFPFDEWAHGGDTTGHRLRYQAFGSSASLSGVQIRCLECGKKRSLAGSFEYASASGGALSEMGQLCRRGRPWLGETGRKGACGLHLRTLQRGASNVYFPYTVSSIYLPLWGKGAGRQVMRVLEDSFYWELLTGGLIDGKRIDPLRVDTIAKRTGVDPVALRQAAEQKLQNNAPAVPTEEDYRRAEYDAFIAGEGGRDRDLLVDVLDDALLSNWCKRYIRRVCLVRKLRETRALAGFTRVLPAEGGTDPRLQRPSASARRWLPATVVRGEGIFLEIRRRAIKEWLDRKPEAEERAKRLADAYNAKRLERGQAPRVISAKYLFLHTLAHLLIKQLSFDCGYGSASLRERLYCETAEGSRPMQGLLIYTASGDSEGTMGGLVRQGKPDRLEPVLLETVRTASWCSADPVCIESPGQGTDSSNLAACHSCALVSETSCEEGNRLLDRGMVVGTISDPSLGLLSSLVGLGTPNDIQRRDGS